MALPNYWKLLIISTAMLVMVVSLLAASIEATARTLPDHAAMVERHEKWMTQFGRTYKHEAEKEKRLKIFNENVKYIEAFNEAGTRPYKLAVNKFADFTNEEFRASYTGYKMLTSRSKPSRVPSSNFRYANVSDVPSSIDWRKKGVVTGVKDQGDCGSCWAFSAVAATEGHHMLKTGKLISLSEQELVDCDTSENEGCNGGLMDDAFEFIMKHGLTSESNYPYVGEDGSCNAKKESSRVAKISDYEDVPSNSEPELKKAVAHKPVSVAIKAGHRDFMFYSSGVFNGECGTMLDHGVTAVGYGETSGGTKYWLVKNSWGTEWGEDGYVRMERDVEPKEGLCGIAMEASYPIG